MRRVAGVLLLLALVGAACGDDDADTSAEVVEEPAVEEPAVEEPAVEEPAVEEPAVEEPAVEEPAVEEPAVEEPAVEEPAVAADLAAVCPNPLVMQDNWFPAAEQGYAYRLIGDAGELDAENGVFRGPLLDTGIDLEIRSGGPYLGFQATTATMQLDPNIHLGIVDTDEQVAAYDVAPTVAVFTPLNISPLVLMWNPEEYSFASFEEIGQSDATVLFFPGTFFVEYMVQAGILREDQLDPSYDGSPARFVTANGRLAQQAFLTTAAWNYANELEEWGKPVDYLIVHDSGYEIYSQQLVVRASALEELRPCLEQVVPILQQSVVDHWTDPAAGNALVLQVVEDLESFWVLYPGMMEFAANISVELGLVGNGPDNTVGNYDDARVAMMVELLKDVLADIPAELEPSDIYTNDFIDPALGF